MPDPLLSIACILVLGIGAQWLAWRIRMASILLLLLMGLLAGPLSGAVLGDPLLDPDRVFGDLLQPLVALSVGLILYEGGLTLRFGELGEHGAIVGRLVTIGVGLTWVLASLGAWSLVGLSPAPAILFGAIVVVTGPTVVIPLLHQIRPSGRIGAVLRWEGIVIDPIGAILAVLVFEVLQLGTGGGGAATHAALVLLKTIGIGGGLGFLAGIGLALLLRGFRVPDFLENSVSLTLVVAIYVASDAVQAESGLFATTVMGVTLANQRLVGVRHIVEFKENLRILIISGLFILLAARLRIEDLGALGWGAAAFVTMLIVLVRPLAVLVSFRGSKLSWRDAAFASVMAPRGIVAAAVSSVFSLRLSERGLEDAAALVPLTFLVIAGTVVFSSAAAPFVAYRLGVAEPQPQGILFVGAHNWGRAIAEALTKQGFRVLFVDTNRADVAAARLSGLSARHESILAEHLLDEIDLGGLGRLVAATPNDWVNVLAVSRFVRVFGRSQVFQVTASRDGGSSGDVHRHLHGRVLFDPDVTYADLALRVRQGAVVKTTPITEAFTIDSFREHYGGAAIPLFVKTASGRLHVITAGEPLTPRPGDSLISLVGPV